MEELQPPDSLKASDRGTSSLKPLKTSLDPSQCQEQRLHSLRGNFRAGSSISLVAVVMTLDSFAFIVVLVYILSLHSVAMPAQAWL